MVGNKYTIIPVGGAFFRGKISILEHHLNRLCDFHVVCCVLCDSVEYHGIEYISSQWGKYFSEVK